MPGRLTHQTPIAGYIAYGWPVIHNIWHNRAMGWQHRAGWGWIALAWASVLLPLDARAQTPAPSFAYIVGRTDGLDLVSDSEIAGPDGRPDGWVRVLVRAPGYQIAEASRRLPAQKNPNGVAPFSGQTGGISGYYVKSMQLRHKTMPGLRWDTIPGNDVPLLMVVDGDRIANAPTGSVAGLTLSVDRTLDLYMADPGPISWRVAGFVLEIDTLDGKLVLEVQPHNIYEANFRY